MGARKAKYVIKPSVDEQFYFVLVAPNGKIILKSEMYTTKQNAQKGIDAVRKHSAALTVIDKC